MLETLRRILGDGRVVAVESDDPRYAPHPAPLVHAVPRTREEVAEVVRAAHRDGFAVVPVGGNTSPRVGPPSGAPFCLLSLEDLDRVLAYEAADQTLTVECGRSVDLAQDLAARDRLFVAVEPPEPGRATLGGVIAAATEGPIAARFGPVRDQVLGLVVVNGDGRITKCGGRVVKNVTGYDLCRLYAGSRGALGILVEATVRLRPLPEVGSRVLFPCPDEAAAFAAGREIRRRVADAWAVHVLSGAARGAGPGGGPGATLVVSLFGFEAAVEAAGEACAAAAGAGYTVVPAARGRSRPVEAPAGFDVLRIAAPPADWSRLRDAFARLLPPPAGVAHDVLRGVRDLWYPPGAADAADPAALDAALADAGAFYDRPRDPAFHVGLFERLPSQRPGGLGRMRALKAAFDPSGVLNPGRVAFA